METSTNNGFIKRTQCDYNLGFKAIIKKGE